MILREKLKDLFKQDMLYFCRVICIWYHKDDLTKGMAIVAQVSDVAYSYYSNCAQFFFIGSCVHFIKRFFYFQIIKSIFVVIQKLI